MLTMNGRTTTERLIYVEGLIDVYGDGKGAVMLTVRREPHQVDQMRSVELTKDEARAIAAALLRAANEQ